MGHRGGQRKTAAPKQTVEITTEVQMPDFDNESQQSKRQRPDEVELDMSDAEILSSELEGLKRSVKENSDTPT